MTEDNIGKYLAKSSSISFVSMIVLALSSIGVRIFLAQGLSKSSYGLFFAVLSLASLFRVFGTFGLDAAVTKFTSKFRATHEYDEAKSSILSSLLGEVGMTLAITLALIILSNPLAENYFGDPRAVHVLIILSGWFFIMGLHTFLSSVLQGHRDILSREVGRISRMVSTASLVLAMAYFTNVDVTNTALIYLIAAMLGTGVMMFLLFRRHPETMLKASGSVRVNRLKDMLKFGLPLILSGVAGTLISKTDTLMITAFRSLGNVGLYQVARPAAGWVGKAGIALTVPLMPLVSELWEKEEIEKTRKILKLLVKYSLIITVPLVLVFLTFSEEIIRIIFGSEYIAAATAMRVLVIGISVRGISQIFQSSLTGIGETMLNMKSIASIAGFNVMANLVLVPIYGATGAAIATGISFLLLFPITFYFLNKELEFSLPFSQMAKTILGGVTSLAVMFLFKELVSFSLWLQIFTILALGLVSYVLFTFLSKTVTSQDLDFIESFTPLPKRIVKTLKRLARE